MDLLHIAFFGPTNSGKSALVNALAGQEVSLVSAVPGTTTDPVRKRIELPGLGPCVLIDTAGLGDATLLGPERERRTRAILDETDIAVLLCPAGSADFFAPGNAPATGSADASPAGKADAAEVLLTSLNSGRWEQNTPQNAPNVPKSGTLGALPPVIRVFPKADLGGPVPPGLLPVSALTGKGIPALLERLATLRPEESPYLTGSLVKPGDCVLLVMPQDSEAPKGRLILPQVQVLRELLDRGCTPLCCTPDSLQSALSRTNPDLVITDSQVFAAVNAAIPADVPLTSFSVLLAGAKGDLGVFAEGARAIDTLKPGNRVLIAEACTHVPDTEDIGRVKIPALLRKKMADQVGHDGTVTPGLTGSLTIDIAAGNDFPEDLSPYALIIHCGACVATATLVRSRIRKALLAGVPITNYGIALAKLQGILDRIVLP